MHSPETHAREGVERAEADPEALAAHVRVRPRTPWPPKGGAVMHCVHGHRLNAKRRQKCRDCE
eukprot:12183580-Heterocapsa_arctica.AAC.1